jgi:hypothetical protein
MWFLLIFKLVFVHCISCICFSFGLLDCSVVSHGRTMGVSKTLKFCVYSFFRFCMFLFKWKLNVHVLRFYCKQRAWWILEFERYFHSWQRGGRWCKEYVQWGFKFQEQFFFLKSHNFNQNPKIYFSTYGSMVLFLCKKWDLYVFVLGCWHVLFMFVTCRHFIVDEGQNEALVWEGLFHSWWWK